MTINEMERLLHEAESDLLNNVRTDLEGKQAHMCLNSAITSIELVRLELERIKQADALIQPKA